MTCTKDCELIEEYREEVEAIADCFTEQATERAIAGNTNVDAWADIDRFEHGVHLSGDATNGDGGAA